MNEIMHSLSVIYGSVYPSESKSWRFTINHRNGFTDEMCMTIVGFSKARCLDHFFSPSTWRHYDRPFRSMAFLTTAMLMTPNSTSHSNQMIQNARIAACLKYFFCWMKDHHLQLNLVKTELLMVSANPSHHHNFSIRLGSSP